VLHLVCETAKARALVALLVLLLVSADLLEIGGLVRLTILSLSFRLSVSNLIVTVCGLKVSD
jgi:hypothetical protein